MPPVDQATELTPQQIWDEEVAAHASGVPATLSPSETSTVSVDTSTNDAPADPAAAPVVEAPAAQPDVADMLAALRAQNEALRNEMRATGGRVAAMQSRMDKGLPVQPSAADVTRALKTPEGMTKLLADFPEFAAPVKEFVEANLTAPQQLDPNALIAQARDQAQAIFQAELRNREMSRIERQFPGWLQTINTPEFKAWRAAQPPEVIALGDSELAEDAISMLGMFKKTVPSVADLQQRRAAIAQASRTTKPGTTTSGLSKTEDQMTDAEYYTHYVAQVAAQKKAAG